MLITDVRTTLLRLPVVQVNGDGLQDILIIEVVTDEGLVGIGEAHTMPTALQEVIDAPVSQLAVQGLKMLLVGQDAGDLDALHRRMRRHCASVLGGRGLVLHAISGIDIALWDLKGKMLGRSLSELLGGPVRDRVDVYASDLMPSTTDALIQRSRQRFDEGFRFMKFGWGKIGASPAEDIEILSELRHSIGPDIGLMVDVGVPLEWEDARCLAEQLVEVGIEFLEEPLDAADFEGYADLVKASPVPIASGERDGTERGFEDLMTRAGLRIIQPDLARCGGIGVARAIAANAARHGAWVVPHCWSSDILVAATAHFLASMEQRALLEYNVMDQPLRTELVVNPIRPVDGCVHLPLGPGLGVELNPETIEKYRVNR